MTGSRQERGQAPRRGGGRPRRVPVAGRDQAPAKRRRLPRVRLARLSAGEVLIFVLVFLVILLAVARPLTNYFEGRSEIARAEQAIEDKERHIEELESVLSDYESEVYVREQARKRLSVVGEGETAFRIIDPGMDEAEGQGGEVAEEYRPWWQVLWDSIAEPAEPLDGEEEAPTGSNLPIEEPPAPEGEEPGGEPDPGEGGGEPGGEEPAPPQG
ncbi:FtsB family cell division protein [Corynebacterium otitidis]|uniref:FtsB family cell division protein n=1 Tax=Corynebacterium otitidis TaxID=29321 RepID=UPI000627CDAB|nr:septum formation initiator family protein [Corynebacterium otitidis]KKO83376.1 hypothetical protein AAV33_06795 [Corynebacterium otitidis]